MDIKKTNKKKLSSLIKQQVPQFVIRQIILSLQNFLLHIILFMESAELNLDTVTDIDQILLETVGVSDSFVFTKSNN